jgi:hypothetical protein
MPADARPMKLPLEKCEAQAFAGLLIYCSDYKCNHMVAMGKPSWPDPVRLSEIEDRFVCQACGNAQIGQLKIGSIGQDARDGISGCLRRGIRNRNQKERGHQRRRPLFSNCLFFFDDLSAAICRPIAALF